VTTRLVVATLASALVAASGPRESRIHAGPTSLYAREIGRGQPVIVLHGGPDFDHSYLLPDLDRLADAFRLIHFAYLECADDVRDALNDFFRPAQPMPRPH
jgi:pimeloyl-ACP methyl ester carboxylesterase